MENSEESKSRISRSSATRYVSAVGAALIATFFDFVRNGPSSAVTKTAVSIKEQLELTGSTGTASIVAIIIFGIIGAVLVCAYQPKETKESFLLGLSVLVVAGLSVPPPTAKSETRASNTSTSTHTTRSFLPMSSAYAQVSQAPREERRIWIILSGPGQRQIPEVNVMAYSGSTGQLLINSLVFTKFSIVVPSEVNQIEISRRGYRSVSFKLTPTIENAVYQIPLEEVSFFSAANFLGPREISVRENVELTQLLSGAVRFCQQGNSEAAAKLATQAELRREKLERDTRRLVCL